MLNTCSTWVNLKSPLSNFELIFKNSIWHLVLLIFIFYKGWDIILKINRSWVLSKCHSQIKVASQETTWIITYVSTCTYNVSNLPTWHAYTTCCSEGYH
jgi:hypothetical protein